MVYTTTQSIVILIVPTISNLASFLGSTIITVMIWRSVTKLTKPYRRIVFMMSVYDIVQSLSFIMSTFTSPRGSIVWAVGNDATCTAQGFFVQIGSLASILYSLSLAIFYLCVVKYNVKDTRFRTKYEPFIHGFSNFVPWFTAIYAASAGLINFNGAGCWIASYPQYCEHDPNVQCIRGEKAFLYRAVFVFIPGLIAFLAASGIMIIVFLTVKAQNNITDRYRNPQFWRAGINAPPAREIEIDNNRLLRLISVVFTTNHEDESDRPERRGTNTSLTTTRTEQTRLRNSSMRKVKEVQLQAILFIAAFLFTRLPSLVVRIYEFTSGGDLPFWSHVFAKTTLGLQGFLNILVYTRPHISTFRGRNPGNSWLKAFMIVVKQGGDSDRVHSRRRSSAIARRPSLPSKRPSESYNNNTTQQKRNHDDEIEMDDFDQIMKTVAILNPIKSAGDDIDPPDQINNLNENNLNEDYDIEENKNNDLDGSFNDLNDTDKERTESSEDQK